MSRIERAEVGLFRIPLPAVLSDSTHGSIAHFQHVTVRLIDSDGAEGVGWTYTVGTNGGAIRASLERDLVPRLLGEDPERHAAIRHRLTWATHYGGRGGPLTLALSAVDIALFDLRARRVGLPLWRFLGGFDPKVPCYAGGIDLDFPLDRLLDQADRFLAAGFRAIKMKVGRPRLSEDVERVRAMREHLGPDVPLMLDANMRWTADQAVRAARALAPFDPLWLEEPVVPEDIGGHVRVMREGGLAVAAGENLRSLAEFRLLIEAGGVAFPEPDATNCGGITTFLAIAHLAEAYGLPVTSHGAHDLTVHLLAALPNRSFLEVHGFGLDRFIAEPLAIADGFAIAPERPGHGVAFDWSALAAHAEA
ncbi:3,6-anhydro-alpha-L-galactonate cycloisomerase [bacterium HR40]|nr:3,6-anhydro-alpha-L-galactonate cycloisomerase [bacterium HR40]